MSRRNSNQSLFAKIRNCIVLVSVILLASCTSLSEVYEEMYGPASPRNRVLSLEELKQQSYVSYTKDVAPILNQRCTVCHSCYDAPCQLKLASIEGLDRGATTAPAYNGARFTYQEPTRLGIDAKNTAQWRAKGFTPVLNERTENPQINLDNSLLYQMLTLKRRNPLPTEGRLPEIYDVGTQLLVDESFVHSQRCPTIETFPDFAKNHPEWGMPFAFPGLSNKEFKTIETWLEQGGRVEPSTPVTETLEKEVAKWEAFLNQASNKEKLMSRYLYEHLFLGHVYFDKLDKEKFFTLVRSRTAPGQPIDRIPSIRPYDDPGGVDAFYYRLQYYTETIVDKTHMPYAFNDQRLDRYKVLFLDTEYEVNELPSYETRLSANPFKAFAAIPAKVRYQFMLDEAHFFISGFIKGPVCRGSIALSVIDDHFWVLFMDPEKSFISGDSEFLAEVSDDLRMPSEQEDSASLLSVWATYSSVERKYFKAKLDYLRDHYPAGERTVKIEQIWDGSKVNDNAALTVYRHYDSATVLKGFVGEVPKTGWIIDYPILERIHYLLVAGFNVFGKAGHQLSTRLYMDFLRMESELAFLAFFPSEESQKMYEHWYRGTKYPKKLQKLIGDGMGKYVPDIDYKSDDMKTEFYVMVSQYLGEAQKRKDYINLCTKLHDLCEAAGLTEKATATQKALRKLSDIGGEITVVFPDTAFLRIIVDGSVENDLVYTIVRNKSYLNVTSLTVGESSRIPSEDTIDIVEGFVGAYPNFFFEIKYEELDAFVDQYAQITNYAKYNALVDLYGVRRTNPRFWQVSDWFYAKYQHDEPILAGLFDLNRYKNR